uniref:Peptidase S1 domain-containing protein n=1 Tax=Neogobius melanostomus TaxID=47308 RepID=A0A8C6WHH0_9GOBI
MVCFHSFFLCGMPQTSSASTGRILGGKNAELGQIPWYLLIKEPNRGGASLINDRWAVTAAHVVDHDAFEPLQASARTNFDNDIALIRFTSRVTLGPNISPICLPENNRGLQENELGTLKHVPIPVYSEQKCRATPDVKMQYTQNMFCAGADGKDSCEKDSGGPYFVPALDAVRPFRLMGIVSWGASCYQREHKGYYTKVENYVQWIRDTIEATEESLKQQESE